MIRGQGQFAREVIRILGTFGEIGEYELADHEAGDQPMQ